MSDRWQSRNDTERGLLIEHVDGVCWYEAPVPLRWHRCFAQTRSLLDAIERCPCGALQFTHGPGSGLWGERNSRKRVGAVR